MKYLIIWLLIINFFSLLLMYADKQKARRHKWRIRESSLLLTAFLGGSIGTLIGMHLFRHKTKHLKFLIGVPLILVLQLLLFAGMLLKFPDLLY